MSLPDGQFLYRANVARFQRVLKVSTDAAQRQTVTGLLADAHRAARAEGWPTLVS